LNGVLYVFVLVGDFRYGSPSLLRIEGRFFPPVQSISFWVPLSLLTGPLSPSSRIVVKSRLMTDLEKGVPLFFAFRTQPLIFFPSPQDMVLRFLVFLFQLFDDWAPKHRARLHPLTSPLLPFSLFFANCLLGPGISRHFFPSSC